MKNIKAIAGSALIGAIALSGMGLAAAGTAAAEDKEANVGPYNCTLPLALPGKDSPVAVAGLMCTGPEGIKVPGMEQGGDQGQGDQGGDQGQDQGGEGDQGQDDSGFPGK